VDEGIHAHVVAILVFAIVGSTDVVREGEVLVVGVSAIYAEFFEALSYSFLDFGDILVVSLHTQSSKEGFRFGTSYLVRFIQGFCLEWFLGCLVFWFVGWISIDPFSDK